MIATPLREAMQESWFGGKAVQLGQALRANLPVPSGAALSVQMVDAIASGDVGARHAAEALLASIGPSLAARSSVVGEDSVSASFAGLHDTVLNLTSGIDLVNAIVRIRESGNGHGALAYRAHRGIAGPARVAVVVQTMVNADRAGVMFTRDPVSGRDERVIEASWGLGEAIVSGLVTPDLYRLDRAGVVVEKRAGLKDRMIAYSANGGTQEISVEAERQRAFCLDAACLRRLHELAERCEHVFGSAPAHDVEWAFEGQALHLLQRRPVTPRGTP